MTNKYISVPDFVADDFEKPLSHISQEKNSVQRSVERVYRLIDAALDGLKSADWDVAQGRYRSKNVVEPFCFCLFDDKFYIWVEERNDKAPIAIFKSRYLAADYFVWLVSKGAREINWELFMEDEP